MIFSLEVNLGIIYRTQVTLLVICDVIGIAQYFSKKFKMAAMLFVLCQTLRAFPVNLYLKHWEQISKG